MVPLTLPDQGLTSSYLGAANAGPIKAATIRTSSPQDFIACRMLAAECLSACATNEAGHCLL